MNKKNMPADMSYFRLILSDYLRKSHPHLATDEKFINARVEAALDACEQAVQNGDNPIEAEHAANEVLFYGLHFSRYDTLLNILWNEFAKEIPEEKAPALAVHLLSDCESIFVAYNLTDDFSDSSDYELLYTELTGAVALYLDEHGI